MSEWAMRRFWTAVDIEQRDGAFAITLDGRPVKTPAKRALAVPTKALAAEIAAEWQAQEETVKPQTMPFTRMANSALDKVSVQHAEVAGMLAAYGDSDLLCYRADRPEGLVQRQKVAWDPLLDWAAAAFEARLEPRTGVMPVAQAPDALARLAARVHGMDAFALAAFHDLVGLTGSLVLGLAVTEDARSPEDVWMLSRIDETWQEEQWGRDAEAHETALRKRDEFLHAARFYALSRPPHA